VTPDSNEPALVVDEPAGGASPDDPPTGPPAEPGLPVGDRAPTEPPPRSSRWLREGIVVVVVAVLVAVLLRTFVVQTFYIPSGSMEPTLQIGDRILVDKLSYDLHGVHRGDIVVFGRPPAENCGGPEVNDLVKRVVGLPGDVLTLSGGYVYVDGRRLDETWLPSSEQGITTAGPAGTSYDLAHAYRVPANDYFVMGDNRTDSCDSRYWGPIRRSLIVGKVSLRVWPVTSFTIF
jgi:signal peptidase I